MHSLFNVHILRNKRGIFFLTVAGIFIYLMSPLLLPLAMGAVITIALYAFFERLVRFNLPKWIAALVVTLAVIITCVIPVLSIVLLGVRNAIETFQNIPQLTQQLPPLVQQILEWLQSLDLSSWALPSFGKVLKSIPRFLVSLFVMLSSVFAFLFYSEEILVKLRSIAFFPPHFTEKLFQSIRVACRLVILAAFIAGLIQALLMGLVCYLFKVPHVALIMLLMFGFSFVPVIGTSPVTISIVVLEFLLGEPTKAVFLLAFFIPISLIDNIIRPAVLAQSQQSPLNFFLAFIAAIGAFQTIGFFGLFLGPVFAQTFFFLFFQKQSIKDLL